MRNIRKEELYVGMKAKVSNGETKEVTSIDGHSATLDSRWSNGETLDSRWDISLRSDGFWGAEHTSGYLEAKEDQFKPVKPPKPTKFVLVYDRPGCGDPAEKFTDRKALSERVKELLKNNEITLETAEVFTVTKQSKLKLSIDFN